MATPVYPATNNAEAIELNISNANQFFTVLQGSIDDFIMTYEGYGEIPSVAKAMHEAAAYKPPLLWQESGQETDLMQPRIYQGAIYAPIQVPADFTDPLDSTQWRLLQNNTTKSNFTAEVDPTEDDDVTEGYSVGSLWFNQDTASTFRNIDATEGAAVWVLTSLTVDELGSTALVNVGAGPDEIRLNSNNESFFVPQSRTITVGEGLIGGGDLTTDWTLSADFASPEEAVEMLAPDKVISPLGLGHAMGAVTLPTGVIVMWSGSISSVPAGWILCDGQNGTPDLRNRFIVGAGSNYAVGDTGGADSVALTVQQLPAHNHTASTGSAGGHTHSGSTNTTGNHSHTYTSSRAYDSTGSQRRDAIGWGQNHSLLTGASGAIAATGNHSHSLSINSNGAHTHTVSVGNSGGGQSHENRPPYYALAYIMKL